MLYFEDIPLHETRESTATHLVTADEIKNFAGEWDPMPFHVDEEVAKLTPMGKLFASGVHSIAISVRLGHTMMDREIAVLAGLAGCALPHTVICRRHRASENGNYCYASVSI